jgi:hypothetical protein
LLRHRDLSTTGRYVHCAAEPLHTLSDMVGERIAGAMAGQKDAEVVTLKRGA